MNILFAVPVVAVLVPFIKVACDHYSQAEKQKRANWKASQKIVAPKPVLSEAAEIAAFVALSPTERQSRRDACWLALAPTLVNVLLFFGCPVLAILCLPVTLLLTVWLVRSTKPAPIGAPSEDAIYLKK